MQLPNAILCLVHISTDQAFKLRRCGLCQIEQSVSREPVKLSLFGVVFEKKAALTYYLVIS